MDFERIDELIFRMAVRLEAMQAITYETEWKPEVDAVRKMINARQPEVVGSSEVVSKLEKAMQLINDIALGSQLCKDNPDYRLPEALCDRFRGVNGMIAPLPAPASSVPVPTDGVVELLQQIVTVAPTEGKDLWIATVKARAASELALLTKGRGGV